MHAKHSTVGERRECTNNIKMIELIIGLVVGRGYPSEKKLHLAREGYPIEIESLTVIYTEAGKTLTQF